MSKKSSTIIDLTNVSTKKSTSKENRTMSKSTKSPKSTAKKTATKKTAAKKNASPSRARITEESISSSIRKAFALWKSGTSLAELARKYGNGDRNALWRPFRVLAGGTEEALHRLRAAGAGVPRGKLRFAKGTAKQGSKGKGKGK